MPLIQELFARSPFGPMLEHTKKVHQCVQLVRPLIEALAEEDHEEIHSLQDKVSKLEYEADQMKHRVREQLPRMYFLPVGKGELENFLSCQDKIADSVEDFAVILLIRKTKILPELKDDFFEFVDQILTVSRTLLQASEEMENLAETSFAGAEAESVLRSIEGLGEEEWKADRMQRKLSKKIYDIEDKLDPMTIMFYEKILSTLSSIANAAENTGDLLRTMIVKG